MDTPKNGTPKTGTPKKHAPKNTPKRDTPKKDISKKYTLRKDTRKQDSSEKGNMQLVQLMIQYQRFPPPITPRGWVSKFPSVFLRFRIPLRQLNCL